MLEWFPEETETYNNYIKSNDNFDSWIECRKTIPRAVDIRRLFLSNYEYALMTYADIIVRSSQWQKNWFKSYLLD